MECIVDNSQIGHRVTVDTFDLSQGHIDTFDIDLAIENARAVIGVQERHQAQASAMDPKKDFRVQFFVAAGLVLKVFGVVQNSGQFYEFAKHHCLRSRDAFFRSV